GQALNRAGDNALGSTWALRRAMEDPEWFMPAGLALAARGLETQQWDLVVDLTEELLETEPENVDALVIRTMALVGTRRDYEAAIEVADRALAIDPDALVAQVYRTVALLGLDRGEEAGEELDVVEAYFAADEFSKAKAGLYCAARASFQHEKGEAERAQEVLLECLERYPANQEVVSFALKLYDGDGKAERSIEVLQKALEVLPNASDYRVAAVVRLEGLGRVEDAEALLREATESSDPSIAANAFADLAGFLVSQEEFEKGIEAFDQAVASAGPLSAGHRFAHADALIRAGQYDRALEVADQLTNVPHRELLYGRAFFEQGDYEQALEHFSAGLLLWPDNAAARYLSAQSAERLGDFERAIEEYRYAIRIDSGATDARRDLARLHFAEGQLADARIALLHNQSAAPLDLELALLDIQILMEMTAHGFALPPHLAAFSQNPAFQRQRLYWRLAKEREREGPQAAVELLEKIDTWDWTHPDNARLLGVWASNLVELGQISEAAELIAAGQAAHPEAADFYALRGRFLEQTGGPAAEIQSAFVRANELDPHQPDALSGRARQSVARGETDAAVDLYIKSADSELESTEALWAAVELLRDNSDSEQLRSVLDEILRREPYDGAAALELARVYAPQEPDRALPWARRAARFDGSPEALALEESLSRPSPSEDKAQGAD
ncbi:MAG: tetratricopeptide repeat protein, partial [Myxococcota bacterium]|nr:tetratricopeptide repeat protein [Myxococcota bacterium]